MKVLILLSVVALVSCSPVTQDDSVVRVVFGNVVNCMNSDLTSCLKEQALKATERLASVRHLKITDGITLHNNIPRESRSLELSSEPEERKKQVSEKLWESSSELLKNSELELSWPADDEESRAIDNVGEARGKKKEIKKKLKILVPLLILAKVKAAAIVIASIVVIAASLAKIALLAKIAFIAKAIAVIKALIHKKHSEEEHWTPHHEEPPSHGWDNGWSRQANNLAYSAYAGYGQ